MTKNSHVRQYIRQYMTEGEGGTVQKEVLYMQEVLYTYRMCRRGGEEGRGEERRAGQGRAGQGRAGQGKGEEDRAGQGRAGWGATKWRRALLVKDKHLEYAHTLVLRTFGEKYHILMPILMHITRFS